MKCRLSWLVTFCEACCLGAAFASSGVMAAADSGAREWDGYVEQVMKEWAVPGVAVAVVQNGQIAFAKGYGTRQRGRSIPIDLDTIFEIGSLSKSFTATAAAILVDEGKLRWDDVVSSHLPQLQLADAWISRHATLEDLAAHRLGFDANIIWTGRQRSLGAVIESVKYLAPESHFGEFFYSNTGPMILGLVIERVSGKTWGGFLQSQLFVPLGMIRTGAERATYIPRGNLAPCWLCKAPARGAIGLAALTGRERNVAAPHGLSLLGNRAPGEYRQVDVWPWRDEQGGPAGALNSTARDMAQWLLLHVDSGEYRRRQLISREQIAQLHRPHVATWEEESGGNSTAGQEVVQFGYGFGWRVGMYRGQMMISHNGGQVGFGSYMCLFPGARTGVVVLENMDYRDSQARLAIARRFADTYLGLPPFDWSMAIAGRWSKKHEGRELDPEETLLRGKRGPQREPAPYVGQYAHPAIGVVDVGAENGRLILGIGPFVSADVHLRDGESGVLVFRSADRWQMSIEFVRDDAGNVSGLVLGGAGGELQPFAFDRIE